MENYIGKYLLLSSRYYDNLQIDRNIPYKVQYVGENVLGGSLNDKGPYLVEFQDIMEVFDTLVSFHRYMQSIESDKYKEPFVVKQPISYIDNLIEVEVGDWLLLSDEFCNKVNLPTDSILEVIQIQIVDNTAYIKVRHKEYYNLCLEKKDIVAIFPTYGDYLKYCLGIDQSKEEVNTPFVSLTQKATEKVIEELADFYFGKEENKGIKHSSDKLMVDELDWFFIKSMAQGMTVSKKDGKYPKGNHFKKMENPQELLAAAQRHMLALWLGESIDPEDNIPHTTKIANNMMMYQIQLNLNEQS